MSGTRFTPEQQTAVETTGRSLLVSAAAGSGKTTVLAERCARLIAEPIDGRACQAAEILVVTFTEAAAAHMRARIGDALRARLDAGARNAHIAEQLALLPAAPISTIHSFCRDLIRRWFSVAQVDPRAEMLAAEEALLLRHETIKAMFESLYGSRSDLARAFQTLVEEDFNGKDEGLTETILRTHEFIRSLPDADGWLARSRYAMNEPACDKLSAAVHAVRTQRLKAEIELQRDWLDATLAEWTTEDIDGCRQLSLIREYASWLEQWAIDLDAAAPDAVDAICQDIRKATLNATGARKPALDEASLERAKAMYTQTRETLLQERLQAGCAAFTQSEYVDGLERIAPKLGALADLVAAFDRRYTQAKREERVLDFSDLEQFAFRLLADDGDPSRPSDVARQCHARFCHVLVDEFQDINPIQAAILRLVSRETAADDNDNLFAVGDVKQCIYAFRLAAPTLFLERADQFARHKTGTLVPLRENFRSRPAVLDAVNALFECCMTDTFTGIAYDDDAALRPGMAYPPAGEVAAFANTAAELHTLEVPPRGAADNTDEPNDENTAESAADWHRVEREAFCIGRRIREFMGLDGERHRAVYEPDGSGTLAPRDLQYRDIVILMRSLRNKADRVARILRQMDIPVHADVRGGYFDSAEVRDMLALLSLLDNGEQDVPLAAILRSPLATPAPFAAGDLATIRTSQRDVPFHVAARRYAESGPDASLRERLAACFSRLDRFRTAAQRQGLADVIWNVYEETGYLAYVGGLPHGPQRRANLIGLHDRARQFGTFRRQGLRRFLHFVDQLRDRGEELATPSTASDADNVVRILSIHQSKGLEFPVVFVADLGARFNLVDLTRPVVMHRDAGLGMKVVDAQRRITYPTLAYQTVGEAIRRDVLAEELRTLYVAMTRAREHLVLVGSASAKDINASVQDAPAGPLDTLTLSTANSYLDWILAALPRLHRRQPNRPFVLRHHDAAAIAGWTLPETTSERRRSILERAARLGPLPADEPTATDDAEIQRVIERIEFLYEPLAMTTVPARQTVTELKRQLDPFTEAEEQPARAFAPVATPRPRFAEHGRPGRARIDAAQRGTLTHRFLQSLDLAQTADAQSLRDQLATLIAAGRLPATATDAVDIDAIAAFFASELGTRLRDAAEHVQRESTFVARVDPGTWDPTLRGHDEHDVILLRGMIDALLPTHDGLELIDYKTDAVPAEELATRVAHYKPQMALYAAAAEIIWRKPVRARWLVFLASRTIMPA
ncbi:MAG: helicase-exonuclease AddAB subunit AddA [Phycisphaerae bacterium]|nr:helicase-exonuclease AddAB subunit AddA [Phycisphaerae bacterium]